MVGAFVQECVGQCFDDMFLTDHLIEVTWTPLSR
jgi:hypothetical protein